MCRVLVVQGCGWLVEDEEFHTLGQRLGDFNELLLANAKLVHWSHWVFVESYACEQFGCFCVGLVPVDECAAYLFVA